MALMTPPAVVWEETSADTGALVDIDQTPDLALELQARVDLVDGRPRLVPVSMSRWRAVLGRMVGRPVTIMISREKKRRGLAANAYLWSMYGRLLEEFRAIAQDAGERPAFTSASQVHEFLKFRFLGAELVTVGGVEIERPASTTKLTPAQFRHYCESIKELAASRWSIDLGD